MDKTFLCFENFYMLKKGKTKDVTDILCMGNLGNAITVQYRRFFVATL